MMLVPMLLTSAVHAGDGRCSNTLVLSVMGQSILPFEHIVIKRIAPVLLSLRRVQSKTSPAPPSTEAGPSTAALRPTPSALTQHLCVTDGGHCRIYPAICCKHTLWVCHDIEREACVPWHVVPQLKPIVDSSMANGLVNTNVQRLS